MNTLLGYCGLDCRGCPIHLATLECDEAKKYEMRSEIARVCNERYGLSLAAQEISDCDGCHSNRLFFGCTGCEIRRCAVEKKVASCAYCDQYACEKLMKMFAEEPNARRGLEGLRDTQEHS